MPDDHAAGPHKSKRHILLGCIVLVAAGVAAAIVILMSLGQTAPAAADPSPPPSMIPPAPPPLAPSVAVLRMAIVAAGEVADFTPEIQRTLRTTIAEEVGVPTAAVSLSINSASVLLSFEIALTATAVASNPIPVEALLQAHFATPSAAESFFSDSGITVESIAHGVEFIAQPWITVPLPLPPAP